LIKFLVENKYMQKKHKHWQEMIDDSFHKDNDR
jgi:hypothetical protein